MAYITIGDLKQYIDLTGDGDDALLSALIDSAQRMIDEYCNRTFEASADTTRYCDAVGYHIEGYDLHVSDMGDLVSITSITNGDGNAVSSSEYTTYPKTLTNQEPTYQRIRLLGTAGKVWTYSDNWENAIAIVGRWAYSTTAPNDIKTACRILANYLYKQKDSQVFDVTAIPDAGVIQLPQGIPQTVKLILNNYVRRL